MYRQFLYLTTAYRNYRNYEHNSKFPVDYGDTDALTFTCCMP